jgi:hypothetical protein
MYEKSAYKILVGKPKGMAQFGRYRCRWMENNKMDIRGRECDVV